MVIIKTEEEIELLRKSNLLVSGTHAEIATMMKPGVSTLEIDKRAEEYILDNGGVPGFKNYRGYPNTLCISVNEMVVHGIPSSYVLKESDIVSVDCGVYMNGFHGDSAYTFAIGDISPKVRKLVDVTKKALLLGIEQAVEGNRVGDIGHAIQKYCERNGFSVVREMVGHGVGRNLHEAPEVPNYGHRGTGIKLKSGMVLAIEPMINMGDRNIVQGGDGWTIKAIDGKPSAHFEHSVVIGKHEADILSDFTVIEEAELTK